MNNPSPLWNYESAIGGWTSKKCYTICTTGKASILVKSQKHDYKNEYLVENSLLLQRFEENFSFPGRKLNYDASFHSPPKGTHAKDCVIETFAKDTNIDININERGCYEFLNENCVVAKAEKANLCDGDNFCSMIFWFKTERELHDIAVCACWNLETESQKELGSEFGKASLGIYMDVVSHQTSNLGSYFSINGQADCATIYKEMENIKTVTD